MSTGARPRPRLNDMCAVERQVTHRPRDLHSWFLRRCFKQPDYALHGIAVRLVNDCEEDPGRVALLSSTSIQLGSGWARRARTGNSSVSGTAQ